ncbi:hypothetical protein JXQ70_11190 [bacterium]|nr:hypothetical protein [bacterium]
MRVTIHFAICSMISIFCSISTVSASERGMIFSEDVTINGFNGSSQITDIVSMVVQADLQPSGPEFLTDISYSITPARSIQIEPSAAFDGTNFMVVWTDGWTPSSSIFGTRIDQSGTVLDQPGFPISSRGDIADPAIAFDGTNYLVIWTDDNGLFGSRVDQQGQVLDSPVLSISPTDVDENPALAYDGTDFLVVWSRNVNPYRQIYGCRVSSAGVVLDPGGVPISTTSGHKYSPSLAFDGANCMVIWSDRRNGNYTDIYGSRVTPDAAVLDPDGIPIDISSVNKFTERIAFDGDNYLVIWEHTGHGIRGVRLSPQARIIKPGVFQVSPDGAGPEGCSLAFDGTNFLTVWSNYLDSNLYGCRIDKNGTLLDPAGLLIATIPADVINELELVFGLQNFGLFWMDDRYGIAQKDILGMRIDTTGFALDPVGFLVSTGINDQLQPAVTFDGQNYLIVSEDNHVDRATDIYGSRVDQSGNIISSVDFVISDAPNVQKAPKVACAWNSGVNFVIWQDCGTDYSNIYGCRVDMNGTRLDPAGLLVSRKPQGFYREEPDIASDGTYFIAVWSDKRSGSWYVYGTLINRYGSILYPSGIRISNRDLSDSPSITSKGNQYLVAYTRGTYNTDIYGCRLSWYGKVLDPINFSISKATESQRNVDLSSDGTNYLAVWFDMRNGAYEIFGCRIYDDGNLLDPNGFLIATGVGNDCFPSVSFNGTNYLVVWNDENFNVYGTEVDPSSATVITEFLVSQNTYWKKPVVASGPTNSLAVYTKYTESIEGLPAYTYRNWGNILLK